MGHVTEYTAVDSKDGNGQDRNRHAGTEAPEPPTRLHGSGPEELKRLIKCNHSSSTLNMIKKQKTTSHRECAALPTPRPYQQAETDSSALPTRSEEGAGQRRCHEGTKGAYHEPPY